MPPQRIIIIGGGIVGSALAAHLSTATSTPSPSILLIDTSLTTPLGSTSRAPGFVGQLNELPALTHLARASVREYRALPGAFNPVGGLEIASTRAGIANLEKRCKIARDAGLDAELISSAEAAQLAPQLHAPDDAARALHFPSDGTANPLQIVAEYQRQARERGVSFLEAKVISLDHEDGVVTGITTTIGDGSLGATRAIKADTVIVATGIWSSPMLEAVGVHLPVIPVAHPYIHGPVRPTRVAPSPFVRWPEEHVYARDHGEFDGFGSYNHAPIAVGGDIASAGAEWDGRFDEVVDRAMGLFPGLMSKEMRRINGLFAVTPDGLPFAGEVEGVKGLWVASAVWITHAAGVAGLMAGMIRGEEVDEGVRKAVEPGRFKGRGPAELKREALGTYNNIYNSTE